MSKIVRFSLRFDQSLDQYLQKNYPQHGQYQVLSKSLDARNSNKGQTPRYHYQVELEGTGSDQETFPKMGPLKDLPIIVGAGPAGLFCALRLLEYGVTSIILERGEPATQRMKSIAKYWRYGVLNPESNVCFGEGGAGLFSDGKLITRVKSPFIKYVMKKFVEFGAPEEITYLAGAHLGSNKIRKLISEITQYLRSGGCQIHFNQKVTSLLYQGKNVVGVQTADGTKWHSEHTILAAGHSAHKMYEHLYENNVDLKAKNFAIGFRVEHPRKFIDHAQLGSYAGHSELGAARYKLTFNDQKTGKGSYSFCMCPGGNVLSSGTNEDGLVANGMSNSACKSPWSNSAIVATVEAGKDFSADHLLNGMRYQQEVEQKAFRLSQKVESGKELPCMKLTEFLQGKIKEGANPKTSCPSKVFKADFGQIFDSQIIEVLKEALQHFDQNIKGFIHQDAVLIAPETRTSAPVTISRDKNLLESTSHKGLYPCGEGAGHAGGITSSAVDGIKVAMAILEKNFPEHFDS